MGVCVLLWQCLLQKQAKFIIFSKKLHDRIKNFLTSLLPLWRFSAKDYNIEVRPLIMYQYNGIYLIEPIWNNLGRQNLSSFFLQKQQKSLWDAGMKKILFSFAHPPKTFLPAQIIKKPLNEYIWINAKGTLIHTPPYFRPNLGCLDES